MILRHIAPRLPPFLLKPLSSFRTTDNISREVGTVEQPAAPTLDFFTTKDTYQSKSTPELLRSFFILKLCTYKVLILKISNIDKNKVKILTNKFSNSVIAKYID